MARRRDPTPFGSRRRETGGSPRIGGIAVFDWWDKAYDTDWRSPVNRRRLSPEFFQTLRALRFTRVRLVVEAVAVAIGALLLFVLPLIGFLMIVVGVAAGIGDLLFFRRLQRRIAEAWQDLALDPE